MPWCGYWATAGTAWWWILPLAGLVFMAVMLLVCFRGFGCMGAWRRRRGGDPGLRSEVESLKDELRKPTRTRAEGEEHGSEERRAAGADELPVDDAADDGEDAQHG